MPGRYARAARERRGGAALFVLSRDLLALIVCHVLVDGMGLVITPLYSQWWKE